MIDILHKETLKVIKPAMGKGLYKLKAFVLILYFVIVCIYVLHVNFILRINMFKLKPVWLTVARRF